MRKFYAGFFCLIALTFFAQGPRPMERIQQGLKTLSVGNWSDAFSQWTRDARLPEGMEAELKQRLDGWMPNTRGIGQWALLRPPLWTSLWQRHWLVVTFDQGALFFNFDHVLHKNTWVLVGLQAGRDPQGVLPHLDHLPMESVKH